MTGEGRKNRPSKEAHNDHMIEGPREGWPPPVTPGGKNSSKSGAKGLKNGVPHVRLQIGAVVLVETFAGT